MARGIRVQEPGGPDALRYEEFEVRRPGPGEALVKVEAVGVNFLDVYHRTGLYPLPAPFTPGSEGAGRVVEVGEGVSTVSPGDRVAFNQLGSYADEAVVTADRLVPIPDGVDERTAAAALLQGLTAHYLSSSTYPLKSGDTALVHAGAGGVGALLVQMAKARGAYVYATASTGKLRIAEEAGADVVIDYTRTDFAKEIEAATQGRGVDVVYDSVGKTTFDGSLNSVRPRGMLVMFGQSSGPVPPFDLLRLSRGSLYITRAVLGHYTADREELLWRAGELFEGISTGRLRLRVDRELPLASAGEAHRLLEGRQTAGKLLLIP